MGQIGREGGREGGREEYFNLELSGAPETKTP